MIQLNAIYNIYILHLNTLIGCKKRNGRKIYHHKKAREVGGQEWTERQVLWLQLPSGETLAAGAVGADSSSSRLWPLSTCPSAASNCATGRTSCVQRLLPAFSLPAYLPWEDCVKLTHSRAPVLL